MGAFLTLHGESTGRRVITRAGARAGDEIYVTGTLGGSLLRHHYNFVPRLAEGAWLGGRTEVRAMMDVSDGLAKDLGALTTAGLAPDLTAQAIPISAAARRRARQTGQSPLFHALCDGEDYELLVVLRSRRTGRALNAAGTSASRRCALAHVGRFVRRGQATAGRAAPDGLPRLRTPALSESVEKTNGRENHPK